MFRSGFILFSAIILSACGGAYYGPPPQTIGGPAISSPSITRQSTPIPRQSSGSPFLTDRAIYSQKDPRWGQDKLGPSNGSLAKEGCVVTSVAMAMTNLGYEIDPGELNRRLMETGNYTPRGWLIWNGVSEVSGGKVRAQFYDTVSEPLIQSCLAKGDYPMVRFFLPNGRAHWAMILGRTDKGYMMRDPLRVSRKPLIFPRDSSAFKSLRCIGHG
ncbi:hypothetical protein GCM10007853_23180 [Algimonas ampicilliniresistens]|uniref:Peptidase C39-like domain-containing protein n=1 Tax=Algimonas ampicilliniresistens TaxID=1298735 RepID=A0ABQ5VBR7_9PROT|nr:hypothetical protein [Algimonas ampicilliniresistens]GLQ24444.1 hypothetical protein GCM10007853_23180 [Algimonas ampicilliniresistens]